MSEELPVTEEGRKSVAIAVSLMNDDELQKVGKEVVGEILRRTLRGDPVGHQKEVLEAILTEVELRAV